MKKVKMLAAVVFALGFASASMGAQPTEGAGKAPTRDEGPPETYVTRHVLPNVPMDPSLFSSPISGTYPVDMPEAASPSDEERLRSIIKTFEEKYR